MSHAWNKKNARRILIGKKLRHLVRRRRRYETVIKIDLVG
jgi:hypothetical protein